ncbi:MAG: hypothetical protein IT463_14465 [Planctomycetes bacterium]|nr:hypothetical protein [Planctomycetota bacterium]
MPLTNEQQELLGAWLDGELRGADLAAAELLLRGPAAAAYVAELRRLRELLAFCPPVRCPVGLKARVLAALDSDVDGISRPTNELAPLRRLRWYTPAAAAAAMLVMGLWVFSMNDGPVAPSQPAAVARVVEPDATRPAEEAAGATPLLPASLPAPVENPEPDHARTNDAGKGTQGNSLGGGGGSTAGGGPGGMASAPPRRVGATRMARGGKSNTLNLDRGHDEPFELVLHVDRERPTGLMHAYNDLLLVSCLYGTANLVEAPVAVAVPALEGADYSDLSEDADGVTHHDFTLFDGVEAQVPEDELPALVAALRRLAVEQNYGEMQVPEDMNTLVSATGATVDELNEIAQDVADDADDAGNASNTGTATSSLRAYLPLQSQSRRLRRDARDGDQADEKLSRLKKLESQLPAESISTTRREGRRDGTLLRVIIRLK